MPAGRDAIPLGISGLRNREQTYFRSRKGRADQQAEEPAGRKQPDPGTGIRDQYEAVRRIQEIQAGFGHPLRRTEPRNRQAAGQQKADLPVEHVPRPALLFFGHVRRGEPDTPLHPIVRTPARPASRLLRGQQPLFPALRHAEQPAQPPARNEYLPGLADDGFRPRIVPVQDTPELQTYGKRQDGRSQGDPRRVAGRGRQGHAALRGDGLCLRLFLPAEQRPGGWKEIFHALRDRRCEECGEGERLVPHAGSDVLRPGRPFTGFQVHAGGHRRCGIQQRAVPHDPDVEVLFDHQLDLPGQGGQVQIQVAALPDPDQRPVAVPRAAVHLRLSADTQAVPHQGGAVADERAPDAAQRRTA